MQEVIPAFVTRENLTALKREVHASLPRIKSSHLAEALAAALGHRTYASLLAALSEAPSVPVSLSRVESTLAFNERLHQFGYPVTAYTAAELVPPEDVAARMRTLAVPEPSLADTPSLDRCASYGIIMRRKPDGSIHATHPVAGVLGPFETLEEAAEAACVAWL